MKTIISYGGGVNSSAMLIEIVNRSMQDEINAILFSDTGAEKPETYQHAAFMSEYCRKNGLPDITLVSANGTLEAECLERKQLPSLAYGFRSCSDKYKKRPIRRWLRAQNWNECEMLIGIDAGESHRTRESDVQWIHNRYPLIEWDIDRSNCLRIIADAALPIPIKSACFFCPASKRKEVEWLRDNHPALYQRALKMEGNAELTTIKGLGRRWSWKDMENEPETIELPCDCMD